MAPSEIMGRITGRSSNTLFEAFPLLKKRRLGPALLGPRVFVCHRGADARRDNQSVSGASLRAEPYGQLSYGARTTGLGPVSRRAVPMTPPPSSSWGEGVAQPTPVIGTPGLLPHNHLCACSIPHANTSGQLTLVLSPEVYPRYTLRVIARKPEPLWDRACQQHDHPSIHSPMSP